MTDAGFTAASEAVVEATGRGSLKDAIAWLGEDHPMPADTDWSSLLRALIAVAGSTIGASPAIRRVVKEATTSDVDTAKVVFDVGSVPDPAAIDGALSALLARSEDGTFGGLTPKGVLRAQFENPLAVEVLCLAAGIAYTDAVEWFQSGSAWQLEQVDDLLSYLNRLINDEVRSPFRNAEPARGIEFIRSPKSGWSIADEMRAQGVPYGLFLAQRAAGGAWLAHKNRTSSFSNMAAAAALSDQLAARRIDFRRSTIVGGSAKQKDLQQLSGIADKRVGLVVVSDNEARYAVGFSTARDGGTARANGDGLLQIPATELPFAFVLTGPGWTGRPETDRLARKFAGRLFTDRTLNQLVDDIEGHAR